MKKSILHVMLFIILFIQSLGCSKEDATTSVEGKSLTEIKEAFYTYVYIDRPVTRLLEITYQVNEGLVVSASGSHTNFFYDDEADLTNKATINVQYEYLPNSSLIKNILFQWESEIVNFEDTYEYEYDINGRLIELSRYHTSSDFPDMPNLLLAKFERNYSDADNTFLEKRSDFLVNSDGGADGIFSERLIYRDADDKPYKMITYPTYYFLEDANNMSDGSVTELEYDENNLSKVLSVDEGSKNIIWEYEYSETAIPSENRDLPPALGGFEWFGFSPFPYFEKTALSFSDSLLRTIYESDGDIYRYYENTLSDEGIPLKIEEYLGLDDRISFEREYVYR